MRGGDKFCKPKLFFCVIFVFCQELAFKLMVSVVFGEWFDCGAKRSRSGFRPRLRLISCSLACRSRLRCPRDLTPTMSVVNYKFFKTALAGWIFLIGFGEAGRLREIVWSR